MSRTTRRIILSSLSLRNILLWQVVVDTTTNKMLIKNHIELGILLSVAVFYDDLYSAVLFFLSSVLIDVDHFFAYWYYANNFSFDYFKIKNWCLTRGARMDIFLAFHNVWFLAMLVILSGEFGFARLILFGVLFHYFCDIVYDYYCFSAGEVQKPLRRWLF